MLDAGTDKTPGPLREERASSGRAAPGFLRKAFANSKVFRGAVCGLLALALGLATQESGFFQAMERFFWDVRVSFLARPGPATDKIVLIELDQDSLDWGQEENGLKWPWPREMYAVVLDFCRRAGAATVTFDVLFTEPSFYGVEDDQVLGRAARQNGRCLLAAFPGEQTGSANAWPEPYAPPAAGLPSPPASFPAFSRASFPVADVGGQAAGVGSVNQMPDDDGVYRHIWPLVSFAGQPMPSLSLATYLFHFPGTKIFSGENALTLVSPGPGARKTVVPLDGQGRALLNYRGRGGTFAGYGAAAVIQSELLLREGKEPTVPPEALRGKHVFFGFTAPGLMDIRATPPGGIFSGLEIQATAMDNLLSGDFARAVPHWLTVLTAAALSLGAALSVTLISRLLFLAPAALLFFSLPTLLTVAAYKAGWWLPMLPLSMSALYALGLSFAVGFATEGRQRQFLKKAFRQYLSEGVIDEIIREPGKLKLGGERRLLTIFFSDLAGFTALSERLREPEIITAVLSEYMAAQTKIILEEGGTLDKFVGDGIVAFWNAPSAQEDHAARAVRAALRCVEAVNGMRGHALAGAGEPLLLRIGVHTGEAVVGNIGSAARFDYTMIGDAVNLASRLEGVNKFFGTSVIMSETTAAAVAGVFSARELGRVAVTGRTEPVRVFEPMPMERSPERAKETATFSLGLAAFQEGRIPEAGELFATIAASDPAALAYARLCETLPHPAPADWDGVVRLHGK